MCLPYHVQYRLLKKKWRLAAEVKPSLPDRRAWVGVYPLRDQHETFIVRYFELEKELIDKDFDISEDELLDSQKFVVQSEAELCQILAKWLGDLEGLVVPNLCDYPI